jgi:hypothetical protein
VDIGRLLCAVWDADWHVDAEACVGDYQAACVVCYFASAVVLAAVSLGGDAPGMQAVHTTHHS